MIGKGLLYAWLHGGEHADRLDPLIFNKKLGLPFDLDEARSRNHYVWTVASYAVHLYGTRNMVDITKLPDFAEYIEANEDSGASISSIQSRDVLGF